jgi:hypothetical protein
MTVRQTFDIMVGERFIGQIVIPVCPIFEYDEKWFREYVESRRPSMAGKDFTLCPTTNKIFKR